MNTFLVVVNDHDAVFVEAADAVHAVSLIRTSEEVFEVSAERVTKKRTAPTEEVTS